MASNWSLTAAPGPGDDAIFDASMVTGPCNIAAGATENPATVQFAANLPANTNILTVDGTLQTGKLDVNARSGNGAEITIDRGGTINVTSTMNFLGGNISGSVAGTLSVTAAAAVTANLHVYGTSALDPPTLGVPLVLTGTAAPPGNPGQAGNVNMDFTGSAGSNGQPLYVTSNAMINVNLNADLDLNDTPLPGQQSATPIMSDGHNETIFIAPGGLVSSDGNVQRTVQTAIVLSSNQSPTLIPQLFVFQGVNRAPLQIAGQTYGNGPGLATSGGVVDIFGELDVNYGAQFTNSVVDVDRGAILVLGQANGPVTSSVSGSSIVNLPGGTITSNGSFNLTNGTLDTTNSTNASPATITMQAGGVFDVSGGGILVSAQDGAVPAGSLVINGTFTVTGGYIQDNVNTANDTFGTIQVNGNVNFSEQATFNTTDQAGTPVETPGKQWRLINWTGQLTGTLTVNSVPPGWTGSFSQNDRALILTEPN